MARNFADLWLFLDVADLVNLRGARYINDLHGAPAN